MPEWTLRDCAAFFNSFKDFKHHARASHTRTHASCLMTWKLGNTVECTQRQKSIDHRTVGQKMQPGFLPTWPPCAPSSKQQANQPRASRKCRRPTRTKHPVETGATTRLNGAVVPVSASCSASRRRRTAADADESVFLTPIFSGDTEDTYCDTSLESCSTTLLNSSCNQIGQGVLCYGETRTRPASTVAGQTGERRGKLSWNGTDGDEDGVDPVPQLLEVMDVQDGGGLALSGHKPVSGTAGMVAQAGAGTDHANEQAATTRVHFSTTPKAARQTHVAMQTDKREGFLKGTSHVLVPNAPNVTKSTSTIAHGQISMQVKKINPQFGGDCFVPHRNGIHTAWRRESPLPIAMDRSTPPVAVGGGTARPTSAHGGEAGLDIPATISTNEEASTPPVLAQRHEENASPAESTSCFTSSLDGEATSILESKRVFLRRDMPLAVRPIRENFVANASSFIRGIDSNSYSSSGGPKRVRSVTGTKSSPGNPSLRLSSAPSRGCTTPLIANGGTRTEAGRSPDSVGSSRQQGSPHKVYQPKPDSFDRRLSPDVPAVYGVNDGAGTANRAAAPLSSAASRRNIANVARKSKVGTTADPVTLYRQRQEAEARRVNAAARKKVTGKAGEGGRSVVSHSSPVGRANVKGKGGPRVRVGMLWAGMR